MRLKEHLDKVSWSVADKMLFVGYGLVTIFQFNAMKPEEMGLFALLITILNWIFIISDAFALQNLIQFGTRQDDRPKLNLVVTFLHITIALGSSLILLLFGEELANFFKESRLTEVTEYLVVLTIFNIPRTFAIKIFYRDTKMNLLFISNAIYFGTMTALTFYNIFMIKHLDFYSLSNINIAGVSISSIFSLFIIRKELHWSLKGNIKFKEIINFSIPYTITSALHLMPRQLDIYIIQYFFQTKIVGIYYLAKNLFRVFEEIVNAANGLIYPAAVRQIAKNDYASLFDMTTKSISYILFFNLCSIIALNLGLTELFINWFLPEKYYMAIPMFNLLSLVALGLPVTILGSVLIAFNKPKTTVKIMASSLCVWFVAFYFVGQIHNPNFIPIPHILYYLIVSILMFISTSKLLNLRIKHIFRFIPDIGKSIKSILIFKGISK